MHLLNYFLLIKHIQQIYSLKTQCVMVKTNSGARHNSWYTDVRSSGTSENGAYH